MNSKVDNANINVDTGYTNFDKILFFEYVEKMSNFREFSYFGNIRRTEFYQSWYSQYQHWCWHYLLWSPCQLWSFYFLCWKSSHLSYWSTSAKPEGVWEVVQRNLREVLFSILFILFHNSSIISNIVVYHILMQLTL